MIITVISETGVVLLVMTFACRRPINLSWLSL